MITTIAKHIILFFHGRISRYFKDFIYRHDRYDLWSRYCADLITKHNMTKVISENVESFTC